MDALSMISTRAQVTDPVVPEKVPQQHEPQFGKVLNKKRQEHQPERKMAEESTETAKRSNDKQAVAGQQSSEMKLQIVAQSEVESDVLTDVEADFQQTFVAMDISDQQTSGISSDGEEESADIEIEPVGLVEPLNVVVDDVADETRDEVLLEKSVVDLPEQPVEVVITPQVDPAPVVVADQAVVNNQVVVPEPLVATVIEAQQKTVIDQASVKGKPVRQQVAELTVAATDGEVKAALAEKQIVATVPNDDVDVAVEDLAEKIDPRFAGLLQPRSEKQPVQQLQPIKAATQLHGSKEADLHQTKPDTPVLAEGLTQQQDVKPDQLVGLSAKQVLEQLAQTGGQHLQNPGQVQVQGSDAAKAMPQTPLVQLSNGTQISESQIFDQVVTQISGSINGESGRMVLRLQPAELGSLKLELVVEGDRVRAHLHAQSHQVQEVLERNLPQLRNALAEQGLKIDQFQVNVDQRQQGGQFENLAQQQHSGSERQPGWQQQNLETEEQIIPLAHLMQNGGGGISLHV